jgi:hypothetical protein
MPQYDMVNFETGEADQYVNDSEMDNNQGKII